MSDLIILESPSKIHTVQNTLGSGYKVVACKGHVRDLPKSKLSVDIEHGFQPTYENISGKEKVIDEIRDLAKKSDHVYFATDPDREGEAISWHLATLLGLDMHDKNRVTFNEITRTGANGLAGLILRTGANGLTGLILRTGVKGLTGVYFPGRKSSRTGVKNSSQRVSFAKLSKVCGTLESICTMSPAVIVIVSSPTWKTPSPSSI